MNTSSNQKCSLQCEQWEPLIADCTLAVQPENAGYSVGCPIVHTFIGDLIASSHKHVPNYNLQKEEENLDFLGKIPFILCFNWNLY